MRIVGGEFRGRSLATPKSNDIRPTIDRTRESLFNILAHAHPGVLDGTRLVATLGHGLPDHRTSLADLLLRLRPGS